VSPHSPPRPGYRIHYISARRRVYMHIPCTHAASRMQHAATVRRYSPNLSASLPCRARPEPSLTSLLASPSAALTSNQLIAELFQLSLRLLCPSLILDPWHALRPALAPCLRRIRRLVRRKPPHHRLPLLHHPRELSRHLCIPLHHVLTRAVRQSSRLPAAMHMPTEGMQHPHVKFTCQVTNMRQAC
jgi:hypothetical protein